jgi:hypothetical protein
VSRINFKSKSSSLRSLSALNVQPWEWGLASLNAKLTSLIILTSSASSAVQSRYGFVMEIPTTVTHAIKSLVEIKYSRAY